MISRRIVTLALAASALVPMQAMGHPLDAHRDESEVMKQLADFRTEMEAAIEAKDIAKLKTMYAESFTHTHGSGKVDGRDARILSVLAREPAIEYSPVTEVSLRVYGDTAILAARSPILNVKEKKNYDFRWTQIYVRIDGKWKLAASQATRLPEVS